MRIISGRFGSREIIVPKGSTTRPSSGLVRGAFFNIIANRVEGARFLDLYAGSGAMGFEALSRGACFTLFVESDRNACRAIEDNIRRLHVENEALLVSKRLPAALKFIGRDLFDLIYIDPPYAIAEESAKNLLPLLIENGVVRDGALIAIESSQRIDSLIRNDKADLRRYGDSYLHLIEI